MARYQQGIGTPETLGVQPTMWKEPKALNTPSLPIQKFNSGATRNYGGLKGGYLDTMQSRWWVGKPMEMPSGISKGLANRKFDQATAQKGGGEEIPTAPTDSFMSSVANAPDEPFTPSKVRFVDEPTNPFPRGNARDLSGFMSPRSSSRTMTRSPKW